VLASGEVASVDERHELFEHILRLRRVVRQVSHNADLSAVRAALEHRLGETVSKRFAARVLGVSHPALTRWIDGGDLPVVYTRSGKLEIPVPALLDLVEAVTADPAAGSARYRLAAAMGRRREAARGLRLDDLVGTECLDAHDRARARSLAYHRTIARRLHRPMIDEAKHVLFRWREHGRIDPRYADRWELVLSQRLPDIQRDIVADDDDAADLRQNSPFAGLLSEPERRRILREVS